MRRIVMFNRVSADGYFAAADGNLDWTVPEPELDKAATEGMEQVDTILFGRRTYDQFEAFWPHAADEDPHSAGRRAKEIAAMARWINEANKLVVSKSRREVTWKGSRLLRGIDEVAAEKQQAGKDIILFGSGSIVS